MRQKELEKWLKIVIIAVALCGLVVCAVAIPWIGHVLIAPDPQISDMYIPWLVLFIISAIPCYVILYLGWRVAVNIGKDRSFSLENARHIKLASKIILFDALYFFIVNVCMWRIYVNHPGVIAHRSCQPYRFGGRQDIQLHVLSVDAGQPGDSSL